MKTWLIRHPDDWHVHLRDDDVLNTSVIASAQYCHYVLVMPNLHPALTTLNSLMEYRKRILHALPPNAPPFFPFMTFYLNETLQPNDLKEAKENPFIVGAKLYPAGVTTNSQEGVHDLKSIYSILDLMQTYDLVLQIHGETIQGDIFDREKNFLESYLPKIIRDFPKLRIVLEHISTAVAVDFIIQAPATVAATITPHHLLYERNDLLSGGIRPHYYCLPILKRKTDQLALQKAAMSGSPKFFAGTDSAPHPLSQKETSCGCAGIYSAPYAIALYATIFDKLDHLDKLDEFLGYFGAEFYRVSTQNKPKLLLHQKSQQIPAVLPLGNQHVVPIAAGTSLPWSVYGFV